jgi:AcrR family transcriptional regulator
MPKLWTSTIETHHEAVYAAALDAAAALVADGGLPALTMSAVASRAGIGRATLYKYFPDVATLAAAWHARQVAGHLRELQAAAARPGAAAARLHAVLEAYLRHAFGHHGAHAAAPMLDHHRAAARDELRGFLAPLIAEAARAGSVRADVPADELAAYCLAALDAAAAPASRAATVRLLGLVETGLGLAPRAPRA